MVIRINNQEPDNLYVGNQPVQKVYRGSTEVWSATVVPPPPPPPSGDGEVSITANITSEVGPAGFLFKATASNFPVERPYHDLRYKWTFGDPGTFSRTLSDNPWENDRNIAYGPNACHVFAPTAADFASAGRDTVSYSVTCEVTDGVTSASNTITVHVTNPDVHFAGNKTILYDPGGNFTDSVHGNLTGALQYTNIEAMRDYVNSKSGEFRILVRRGVDVDARAESDSTLWDRSVQFGNYGNPADPKPIWRNMGMRIKSSYGCVWGIDLLGAYDPTDPTSPDSHNSPNGIDFSRATGDDYAVVYDCEVAGWNQCISAAGGRENIFIGDTYVHDWYDFGFFMGSGGWIGFHGVAMQQNPLTKNYDGEAGNQNRKYGNPYANHGPIRVSRQTGPIVMSYVDFASFNSWSVTSSNYAVQPPFRINAGGEEGEPELMIDRARSQGGKIGMPITNTYDTYSRPARAIFDKVYHIAWVEAGSPADVSFGGATFRNMIIVQGDTPWGGGTLFQYSPGLVDPAAPNANRTTPLEFYNITFVKLQSGSNFPGDTLDEDVQQNISDGEPRHENLRFVNNVIIAPAWGKSSAGFDMRSLFTPLARGKNYGEYGLDTTYALSPSDAPRCKPLSRIAVSEGSKVAVDDFYGRVRGANPSKGAIEP